ncbi:AAA family ATPase [Idiomarina abyssalis]|uniref:AAA family ATPase n=1 Tax=Idiomarina abyssalis TaxID=86102 RepID=A0A8I1KG60_9GAMM|nr:AAA family ATPase [Idiomarina abyssalis]MBJ7267830.1 AAA family ATPase [Idiomarina abyssalis]MBJ7273761.1 AAA family ATPase [Idiomarina abyssalis]MBJ7314612.1 AAA family ATPase [Idiomarina abyssalis]
MQALATTQHIVAAPVKTKPSQQQVIDQLHQNCQQSVSLIMLHGKEGSGKTTIAEVFLEQASEYAEVAFISANERSTNDRLRAQILNQLFGTISINDESLSRQMQRQRPLNHAIIVIDNGELLSESFLAECISTVTQLSAIGQRTSIIITGDSRWAQQQRPAPHLRVQGPTMIEVQPLNHDEQIRFVQALLPEKQRSFWNLERIQQFLNSIHGFPGEIQQRLQLTLTTQAARYRDTNAEENADNNASEQSKANHKSEQGSRRKMRLWPILLIAAIMSLAFAGFLNKEQLTAYWQQVNPESAASAETTTEEGDANSATTAVDGTASEATEETTSLPSFEPLNERSLELVPAELAASYRNALGTLNTVAASEITEGEISLGFIKQQPKQQKPQEAEPAGQSNEQSAVEADIDTVVAKPEPEVKAEQPEPQPQQSQPQARPFQTQWALDQNSGNYTLQISIISDPQLLRSFRNDYGIAANTQVYQRADQRYVVIFGSYPSIEQARAAATQLPTDVQQMEPWAKSFASVQNDITSQ